MNWVGILLAQLMKLESREFFDRFLENKVLEGESGLFYAIAQQLGKEKANNDPNAELKQHLDKWGIKDVGRREHLLSLVEAMRARASVNFRYMAELGYKPHLVTWKEFREVFGRWNGSGSPNDVDEWLRCHAAYRSTDPTAVAEELFQAALDNWKGQLSLAADSDTEEEHGDAMRETQTSLHFVRTLASGSVNEIGTCLASPESFKKIWLFRVFSGVPSNLMA